MNHIPSLESQTSEGLDQITKTIMPPNLNIEPFPYSNDFQFSFAKIKSAGTKL